MEKTLFEDYLKEVHSKGYMGTDDDMPDAFESWLCALDSEELIAYANRAMEEQN